MNGLAGRPLGALLASPLGRP
ncbi:MAG: hypothetical protein CISAcid_16790 [uncultured Acidilobus sp. CIS]|jgi:hypothetical protein|nr:MAG: hypothetical protein CISAcid_16790 [uncultured Acidilobus sp. CIS]